MNRADRLRKVAPGATDEAVSVLSALPADQVALIATFARQAGRDALSAAADRKRQRKADDRANGNYDEESYIRRNMGGVTSQARRAWNAKDRKLNTSALEGLAGLRQHLDAEIAKVVAVSRDEGYSDAVIADALGITRQAVWQRYRRKGSFARDEQAG